MHTIQNLHHRQTLRQSNITPKRTFKSWYVELKEKWKSKVNDLLNPEIDDFLSKEDAEMYYNGGYSPKQAIQSHLRIPANQDLFTC